MSDTISRKATPHPMAITTEEIGACFELCRLQNNIGFWVVWLPTAWSIAMAYRAHPEISGLQALRRALEYIPLCFGIKSLEPFKQIMTIDDLLDYDVDALVERTKNRAIPRGAISVKRAWLFFSLQVIIGVYVAMNFLGRTAFYVSAAVYPLYIIYPTCKRWTNLAPIPLGLMFKVGVFMGWADLTSNGAIPWRTLAPVYFGACLWTMSYETVYQHQDKIDDIKIGLHSPALLFAEYTIPFCTGCSFAFITMVSYGGILNGHGPPFFIGMAVAGAMLFFRLWKTDIDRPGDCRRFFLETPRIGQLILAGLVVDALRSRNISGLSL
ncbi:UbiA prenyltransferase [Mycena crocata]|nr:UbiA prenyltransferase [Mycena crocata]